MYFCKSFMDKNNIPFIIAGPCSVESYDQLREVTETLRQLSPVRLIRAGVWKPRTRPGAFEGLGEPALRWMQSLAKEYGVNYCCEVARPEHVALCHQYGINTIWLGARTTANPFMVEEICNALRSSDMTVLIKNPVCPDARLWIGAVERLRQVGITNIMAVHRGFSMYHNNGYRNAPLWEVAMEFRREQPDIPILCDPSHIGGRRDLIEGLSITAMQLDYDGLMVEVHPHPSEAWSDADQQIDPQAFTILLDNLHSFNRQLSDNDTAHLAPLRQQIDDIDHELLRLMGQRMELSQQIAHIKQARQLSVYQSKRWEAVVADRLRLAEALGLRADFIKELLEKIHAESIRVQIEK